MTYSRKIIRLLLDILNWGQGPRSQVHREHIKRNIFILEIYSTNNMSTCFYLKKNFTLHLCLVWYVHQQQSENCDEGGQQYHIAAVHYCSATKISAVSCFVMENFLFTHRFIHGRLSSSIKTGQARSFATSRHQPLHWPPSSFTTWCRSLIIWLLTWFQIEKNRN